MMDHSTNLQIQRVVGDFDLWDKYIKNHPNGTLYHLSGWKDAIENTFHLTGHYYIATDNKKILGVLPLFLVKTLFSGKKLISIPFAVYGGILADSREIRTFLLQYAIQLSHKEKVNNLELRNLNDGHEGLPEMDLYVTFIKKSLQKRCNKLHI